MNIAGARRAAVRYGFVVSLLVLATLLRQTLSPVLGENQPFIPYLIAVAIIAWSAGPGTALASLVAGACLAWYYFVLPQHTVDLAAGLVGTGLYLAAGAAISFFTGALLRSRARFAQTAAALQEQREWLSTTLISIGDAVIATDIDGRITFMNKVAESLTGWRNGEGVGRQLAQVLRMVDEQTRAESESPAARVFREQQVIGITDQVLIARDGTEIPIEDSGAPIRDSEGQVSGAVLVFRDISERRRAEAESLRMAAIVDSSEDAIIGKSLDGTITDWNKGAQRLYGYSAEEVIGRPVSMLIPPEAAADELLAILNKLVRGEAIGPQEGVRIAKDGTRIYVSLTISPIRNRAGRIIGAATIARDITARKLAEAERRELLKREQAARAEAEAANRAKDIFLATVSHELRTPLNAILGWARLLSSGTESSAMVRRGLETIERNARSQAELIDDLLDVSRIISGKLRIETHPIDLCTAVEVAADSARFAAENKGVRLELHAGRGPAMVMGDASRLQQIVGNLLSNAIKFTPSGAEVELELNRTESNAEIVVRDTGQGISPEFLPHVFDRFRQADGAQSRAGLGLGLAIVRHLVELHGGTVRAESAGKGQGATFIVTLPLIQGAIQSAPAPRTTVAGNAKTDAGQCEALGGIRVLAVDDERDVRELVARILAQCGAEVITAGSAAEALSSLRTWNPDALVVDIGMPGEDGYSMIDRLRRMPPESGGRIPALALTAFAQSSDRSRALACGFQCYLTKPVEPEELVHAVRQLARPKPVETTGRMNR